MTTLDLIVYGGALVAAVALAYAATTRPARRRVETGAVLGWSPKQDQADTSNELTPTGLLECEAPATLDDGTVCGARGLPSWEALSTDTHHALDLRWEIMLAEFRHNMDAIIARLGEPATVGAA